MSGFPWALCPLCCLDAGVAQQMQLGRWNSSACCVQCCIFPAVIWGSIQGMCVAGGAHVALSCRRGGCVGWVSTASVSRKELRWLLLLFSMREVPGCWCKIRLCPAPAHGVAGTREVADFPLYSKTCQHLEMEAQPLGAELPAGEFKSSCHLPSHCKGGFAQDLPAFHLPKASDTWQKTKKMAL